MFRVYMKRHKSWGELYLKSLFWLGSFELIWSSKRYEVRTNEELGKQHLQFPSRTPAPPKLQPLPLPTHTKASAGNFFAILQFYANGMDNKQVELSKFLEQHKIKVAVIHESKLTLKSLTPNIQNFTIVRKDSH